MTRWGGCTAATATMSTASSSGFLKRTFAQFARLLSPRLEEVHWTQATPIVYLGGTWKVCLLCLVQSVTYIIV